MNENFATVYGLYEKQKELKLQTKAIGANGTYTFDEGYDGLHRVYVNVNTPVPVPKYQEKTVTKNGEVTADEGYDALSKVIVDVVETEQIIEPLTITKNGTYNLGPATDTDTFSSDGTYDIPVTLSDGTTISFKKSLKISQLSIEEDPRYTFNLRCIYNGYETVLERTLREVIGFDFTTDANGDAQLFAAVSTTGIQSLFVEIGNFNYDLSKVIMFVIEADRLAGTPYEGKFESGYVYFSDQLSTVPNLTDWQVTVKAPGFKMLSLIHI